MVISIASGKGGTGKTTLATNLAAAMADAGVQLLDCDVEEPNAHLFLDPEFTESRDVALEVPEIDLEKCTYCGKCQQICRFNAIAVLPQAALVFPELCHSCGGCFRVCPEDAIKCSSRIIGTLEKGRRGDVVFAHGRLRVGEAMAPPLIREVRAAAEPDRITLIDAPPGTSCPVIAALKGADFALLVTEATPFGLNDLELAVGAVRKLDIPMGLVINRSDLGDGRVRKFAENQGIPLLMELPFDRKVAEAYARGRLLVEALPEWRERMRDLFDNIRCRVEDRRRDAR
jgi:MinD superfamily P-loop ATPase